MPELTTKGVLKIFIPKSFEKDGETIEYKTCYFLVTDEEGADSVIVVNTKQDLSEDIDQEGTIKVRVAREGKLSLVSFKTY